MFDFNSKLLEAPKTLKEFVYQYKKKKEIFNNHENQNNKINRTVLCNWGMEVEDNFLLDLIATCPGKQADLVMYFTVNTVFYSLF